MARKVVRESVSLYDAKTHLSALIERAASGTEIVITKSGRPRARIVPLEDSRPARVAGKGKGAWRIRGDFDAPLPDDMLASFEGHCCIRVRGAPDRVHARRAGHAVADSPSGSV